MNVIIANKNKDIFSNLDVPISKRLDGEFSVEEISKTFANFYFNKMFLDITALKNYTDLNNIQRLSISFNVDRIIILLDSNDQTSSTRLYLSRLISMGFYNFTNNLEGLKYLYKNPNSYRDVAHLHQFDNVTTQVEERIISKQIKVLGIKNLTSHAGATTLIYMLKKQLSINYYVIAIEVDKKDFIFFNDKDMISTTFSQLGNEIMKHQDADIILIDLNESNGEGVCGDVLYLMEPSTIRLNRMVMVNRDIFNKLIDKKLVLNKSLLNAKDISDFEFESNSKVFYNLPPMDDKKDNSNVLLPFLNKLGFVERVEVKDQASNNSKIFGLFKF